MSSQFSSSGGLQNDGDESSNSESEYSDHSDDEMDNLDQEHVGLNDTVHVEPEEGECRSASVALLLELMKMVKHETIEVVKLYKRQGKVKMTELYDDLQKILDALRLREEEEDSRVLNFDVCDLAELVRNDIDTYKVTDLFLSLSGPEEDIKRCLRPLITRMLSPEFMVGSENIVEEETDYEDVVGLGHVTETLLDKVIFNEVPSLSKFIIIGHAGVGKTTLARKLYTQKRVVGEFECRAWLRVPSDFSHKGVLMKLIQLVSDGDEEERILLVEKMMHSDIPTLLKMLHQRLQGRRYLIVIDDVPKEMYLGMIFKGLPAEDKGSRLLLTSRFRNDEAGLAFGYKMEPLGPDHSWELFMQTVFGGNKYTSDHEFPKQLEREAKEMLPAMCGGVPSAIKNVGMQVAKMRESKREWEEVLASIDFDTTLELLEKSYKKLKPKKRSCFMYMACFKENTAMHIEKLEHNLVAVGAVNSENGAQSCVITLIEQSFVEVEEKKIDGFDKSCRMNPMLHRLSIKKAEEEIGFEILSNNGEDNPRRSQRPRHRVIKCSRDEFDYSTDQDKHLVSLFFHGGGSYLDARPSYWISFEKLKILNLEGFGLKILPEGIGMLEKLRYLGLRNNYIRALPRSLRSLKELEVLDITQNFMVEVPDIVWDMDNLLHLYMSDVTCRKPLRIDAQWSLITLSYISVDDWTCVVSGSEEAIGVRKLGLEGLDEHSDVSELFASLAKLKNLDRLVLKGSRYKRMPCLDDLGTLASVSEIKLDGLLERLPRTCPSFITGLKLVNTRLDQDPMPVLGKFPNLEYLKLENAYTGQEMGILDGEFPQLEVLRIKDLRYLRNLRVGKGAMASLEKLEIESCPYLDTLPEELGSMSKLYQMKMVTTKSIERKIRNLAFISQ